MRTIKFRGRDIQTGQWLFGDLVRSADGKRMAILGSDRDSYDECEVIPETVCQFTGLFDCKFNPIYEGDVLAGINEHSKVWGNVVYYDTECAQYCGYRCKEDLSVIGDPEALTYFHITEWDKDRKVWYLMDTVITGNLWDIQEPKTFESTCLIVRSLSEFRKFFQND